MNRTTVHKKMPDVLRGGRLRYNKPCERCGQMMHNVGSARKYCNDCALLARRDNAERFRRCHRPGKSGPGKGVPDLCLPVPRGQYAGLYIELKTPKGRTTPEQDWWIEHLNAAGCFAEVCHGWESAVRVIERYMSLEARS